MPPRLFTRFFSGSLALLISLAAPHSRAEPDEVSEEESEAPVYGSTVIVTASKVEQEVKEAPVAVTVIRAEELETSPADNYADLLRKVPGLNVTQLSARDVNISSRSVSTTLSGGQLALLDGRSIYLDFFGFIAWDFLPVGFDEIKQIEVIRGPGSAIWGANALTGVVNIITKTPAEIAGTSLRVAAGELGTFETHVVHAGTEGRLGYKVSAAYFEQDAWERDNQLPDGTPFPAESNFQNTGTEQPKFDLRFDFDTNDSERWSFSGGFGKTAGIIHTGIGPFDIQNNSILGYGLASYQRDDLVVRGYLNVLDGDGVNLLNGLNFIFETKTLDFDIAHQKAIGDRHLLSYGGNIRSNFFDLSIAPRDDQRTEGGVYLQDDIFINDTFRLNVGARVDHFDTIGTTFSPRTSLLIHPNENHTLRMSYNRAYRAPSLVHNFLETAVPNVVPLPTGPFGFISQAVGNEDLDEATLDAYEVGWTGNFSNRATFSLSVYFTRTKDEIDFFASEFYSAANPPAGWPLPPAFVPPGTLPSLFTYRNIGQVDNKGVEAALDVDISPEVSMFVNYSYQDEPDVSKTPDEFPVSIPAQNRFNIGATFVNDYVQGQLSLNYTDDAFFTDVLDARFHGPTESFTMLNGSFAVKLFDGKVSVGVRGTNLTDESIKNHVFGDTIRRKVVGELRLGI